MSAIFISYTGRDPEGDAWADRLVGWFKEWGYGYFRDKDPIGQQIRRGGPNAPPFTVVGVVGTINTTTCDPLAASKAMSLSSSACRCACDNVPEVSITWLVSAGTASRS